MSAVQRMVYRVSKNPIVAIFLMPPIIFFVVYRIPFDAPRTWRAERWGVHATNLALLCLYGGLACYFGLAITALLTFGVVYPAAVIGVSLFLVQHKFEGVHWEQAEEWNSFDAALTGCSFLRLPRWLDWFSGSIGLHHIHHAAPGIPNYRLAACHEAHTVFANVKTFGLGEAVKELFCHTLWDEAENRMVSFAVANRARPCKLAATPGLG